MILPFSYASSEPGDACLITVCRAGYNKTPVNPDFRIYRDNTYPYCNIHFAEAGSGFITIEGQSYAVKEGNFFIIDAFRQHEYYTSTQSPFILKWVEFSGGLDLIRTFIKRWKSPVIDTKNSLNIINTFNEILTELQHDEKNYFKLSKEIYSFLVDCISLCDRSSQMNSQQILIKKVTDYIEIHLDSDIKIRDLAEIAGYSKSYFIKFFKNHTGFTPNQMISRIRHHKSRNLLITTDLPIIEIAHSIKYYDTSHFIKDFKRNEGITPSEYRHQSKMYR